MFFSGVYYGVWGNIMELINKNCEHCGDLMINVVPKRMYCDKCRRERRNELKRRTDLNIQQRNMIKIFIQ